MDLGPFRVWSEVRKYTWIECQARLDKDRVQYTHNHIWME